MGKITFNEIDAKLTPEEIKELEAAASLKPVFDEDSPEMTVEMLKQFKKANSEGRKKQTVSLRLSPGTLKKAKLYGRGYTSFLSRLLDEAIKDDSLVRKCI